MRHLTGPLVRSHGLELVQARSGIAAFELLEQVPDGFASPSCNLDMPDLSGAVILETLRLFRPDIATICLAPPLSGWRSPAAVRSLPGEAASCRRTRGSDNRGARRDPVDPAGHRHPPGGGRARQGDLRPLRTVSSRPRESSPAEMTDGSGDVW